MSNQVDIIQNVNSFLTKLCCIPENLCKNINFSLFLLCLLITGQSMVVTGQLILTLSVIQKIYGYSSSQMAITTIVYNIFFGATSIIIGFFSVKNKLLWISIGGIIMSMGCFLFLAPHYIYIYSSNNKFLNNNNSIKSISGLIFKLCKSDEYKSINQDNEFCKLVNSQYLIMFCISYALLGIGSSLLITLSITYFDEKLKPSKVGVYIAVFNIFGVIGPLFGFFLGKIFLSIPLNLDYGQFKGLTPESENWVGAWWLGYIFPGVLILIISIIILIVSFYSVPISDVESRHSSIQSKSATTNSEKTQNSFQKVTSNFKNVLTNFPFMLITLGAMIDVIPLNGFVSFLSKIIEVQFRMDTATVSILTGGLAIVGVCFGFLIGSIYNKYVKNCKKKLIGVILVSYLTLLLYTGAFFGCPERTVLGVKKNKDNIVLRNASSECNLNCKCNYYSYEPICEKSITYYNPCTAGCTKDGNDDEGKYFENCSCLTDKTAKIRIGGCVDKSWMIFSYIPMLTCALQTLENDEKGFAIGLQMVFIRLGYILGPSIYGYLIDRSCILWAPGECENSRGFCAEYNNPMMR